MPKSKNKLTKEDTVDVKENLSAVKETDDSDTEQFSGTNTPLMPELEELVKKNPNRLIGCGG
jgi:hypothetical protein